MPLRIRSRTLALLLALYAGGYALAIAQPEAAQKQPPAAASSEPAKPAAGPATSLEESPLLVEPKTPAEFFDAAVLTDRLYRPGLTKRYLEKLLQANPSDAALLEIRDKYGPGIFLHLARDPALKPVAGQLVERVTAVLLKQEQDPAFLDSLIDGLQGSPSDRETAIQMLKNLGPGTVPRILTHLGAPKPNEQPSVLVQALAQMGKPILPVLYGGSSRPTTGFVIRRSKRSVSSARTCRSPTSSIRPSIRTNRRESARRRERHWPGSWVSRPTKATVFPRSAPRKS